jgi:hypothetical protein
MFYHHFCAASSGVVSPKLISFQSFTIICVQHPQEWPILSHFLSKFYHHLHAAFIRVVSPKLISFQYFTTICVQFPQE